MADMRVRGVSSRDGRGAAPLEAFLRRRRRLRRWAYAAIAACLLAAAATADRGGGRLAQAERVELEVVEVVDAGTLRLRGPGRGPGAGEAGEGFLVRLAGVDFDGPWAPGCERALRQLLADERVRMTWRERLPRPGGEAYVYLADGRLLNEYLIEAGHARAAAGASVASTHALTPWFQRVEHRAAQGERGLWTELNLAELAE